MKKLNKKKGFTIVELVIVIAVVGVLTAVLVPTFVNLANQARKAENQTFVKNLNTQMAIREATEGKNKTMYEAMMEAEDIGFNVEKLTPYDGNDIVWDSVANRFAIVGSDYATKKTVVYADGEIKATSIHQLWKIYAEMPEEQTYSIYAKEGWKVKEVKNLKVGFDAGKNTGIATVSYIDASSVSNIRESIEGRTPRMASSQGQEVVIRTNNKAATLNINAPEDTVKHFGAAGLVDITSIASTSYYEHGDISLAKIANGRAVVTEDAKIEGIHATATNDSFNNISIAVVGQAKLPSIARDKVSIDDKNEQGVYSQLILEVQTLANEQSIDANPEYVWVSVTVDGSGNVEKTTEVASSKEVLSEETIIPASSQSSAASAAAEESKETSTFIDVANADDLNSAVAMNADSIKIRFLDDIEISSYLDVTKSTSIFGQGHKLTSTAKRVVGINDVSNVSVDINNLDLILKNNDRGDKRGINLYGQDSSLSLNGCTVKNFYEDNPLEYAINIPGNNGLTERLNVSIVDSYVVGWAALNTYASDSSFVIKNSTLHGINTYSGTSNAFATIVFDGGDLCYDNSTAHHSSIVLENSIIIAEERTEQTESWISFQYGAENNAASVSIDPKTRILDAVDGENKISTFYMTGLDNAITVYLNGIQRAEILAKGYLITDNLDGSSTITPNTADFVWYSNGAFTTNKSDAASSLYASFATPFLNGWMASGEGIMLFKDIALQNDVACNVTSGTIYLYLDGHSISGGKLLLSGSVRVVSDSADLSSVLGGGSILKVDNPNGTYTYSL